MGLWQKWKEFRSFQQAEQRQTLEDLLLSAGLITGDITKEQALNIPAVSSCVGIISDTVASLPVILYKAEEGRVTEIERDNRVDLLNDDTKDTMDAFQFKKALVEDYLLAGAGYSFINRERNNVKSLHYVDNRNVAVNMNADPIFKSYDILVHGSMYRDFEFLKITRKSKDGVTGKGIILENNRLLSVAYNTLIFEDFLVKTGGNKKGFLKSQGRLSKEAINELKAAWNNLYKNNTENVVVLNNGLDFQEASNTSVEMQLNENKQTNSSEICKVFVVPPSILDGTANDEVYNNWIKVCILPILIALQTALNKDLLLPSEKGSFYFAFDTKELFKGDMLKRYQAYEIAIKNGFMQWDEVRYIEDLEPYGVDFIKLGLQDVLYNPKTKEIYTPNTNKSTKIDEPAPALGGGDDDENRNPREPGAA
ncbi:phage portal protein [Bacillus sp. B-jedd]|uniref:phage portal protein n=1 Tax=Bacillus sp. B-jedd TaxID=1476857 RepID=UPI0005157191|nr:phage portal protein [Bacillus sp. B-jedd]CEG26003.1 phage portal protein, HK97 family [Bacillus sp. B-jedd]